MFNSNFNALVTRHLIGQSQEFETVYSAIYRRKSDATMNVASLTKFMYGEKYCVSMFKLRQTKFPTAYAAIYFPK